jgi:hypothetical protein
LLDFGFDGSLLPATEDVLGTPEYWAPEQAAGDGIDARTDVYSLGIVLYEALCGRTPFSSHSYSDVIMQQMFYEPAKLLQPAYTRVIPAALQELVLRCLRKDRAARYVDGAALLNGLRAVGGNSATSRSAGRGPRQRFMWAALGGVLLLLGVALARLVTPPSAGVSSGMVQGPALASVALAGPGHERPQAVLITFTSDPNGAEVYAFKSAGEAVVAAGDDASCNECAPLFGTPLGTTPTQAQFDYSKAPVEITLRFAGGETTQLTIVPDRSARVHAQSPGLGSQHGARELSAGP